MSLHFQRKKGAAADIKELEYIIALHQTIPRETATISSIDVHRFLQSRYALSPQAVSQSQIAELLRSLGGCDDVTSTTKGSERIHQSQLQSSVLPSPHLPESSIHAVDDHESVTGEKQIICDSDGNNITERNENVASDRIHLQTLEHAACQLDEKMNETTTRQAVLQNDRPNNSHCQLDLVQIVSLLLIPTFAAASIIRRDGVKPMQLPPLRGDSWFDFLLKCLDRLRAIPILSMYVAYESTLPNVHFMAHKWRLLVTGDDNSEITEETVRRLLLRHGEELRAKDSVLVKEMVELAQQSNSGRLNAETWLHVLSADLVEWNVDSETDLSSFFQDVFGGSDPGEVFVMDRNLDVEEAEQSKKELLVEPHSAFSICVKKKKGVQVFRPERTNIDLVVDTHASSFAVVLVWLFYLFGFIVYGSLLVITIYGANWCDLSKFSCQVSSTVVTWAVLAVLLSVAGVFVIAPMSYGNNPYRSNVFRTISSVTFSAVYGCIPLIVVRTYEDYDKDMRKIVEGDAFASGQAITLAICVILVAMYVSNLLLSWIRSIVSVKFRALRYFLSTSNVRGELCLKYAASRKMNKMIENARLLHRHRQRRSKVAEEGQRSSQRDAFRSFLGQIEQYESCGGFFWTWKRVFNGDLLSTEGVWINTRLIIMQVAQVVVGVFFAVAVLLFVTTVADEAEEARSSLPADTPTWVVDLFPTGAMIKRSFYPSAVLAMVAELFLILIYIPSATATVLKYRSQVLPSFRSTYFYKYRGGVDSVYTNAANGVWCMIGSAILIFFIFGIIFFLFQWPYSQKVMLLILGWSIGLSVTIALKMLLTMGCRSFQYRSFFRIRPGAARVSSLALECWYFGLASSTALCRVLQFLLAAALWVGRIDVNFLAEDVNFLGYGFDYVPSNFVKDLLVHEAHRHPYMERLAQMYLMKLKHPDSFGTRAGAAWRQLAVVALFPWMTQYRVLENQMDQNEDDDISLESDGSDKPLDLYEATQQRLQVAVDTVRQQDPRELLYQGADHVQEMVDKVEHRLVGARMEL
ncbi:hypothetical protein FisN_2Lh026 [Fistulifera solaris]|uniref:Uncharacterized protein n=1 Tax=Fistulifera solaris TaxID=1519565 RepID=A0A1Z5JWL2_FISSO|nr:hypothetical protein FisN_2Lh026 [Fistulifera solaris]|eukprot:GAX18404.1 hypothetical protein FisN_2Lh026 [Fistulifera solaris]